MHRPNLLWREVFVVLAFVGQSGSGPEYTSQKYVCKTPHRTPLVGS
jgi:hypothetical protein